MPRPSLGAAVRRLLPIGLACAAAVSPLALTADDVYLDDQIVPVQFQQLRKSEAKKTEDTEDPCTYQGLAIVQAGSSSTAMRKQAVAEMPVDALPEAYRDKVQSVIKGMSLYRRLPTISFEVDRNVYAYFLRNPEVAVSSWRAMGISKFALEKTGPQTYQADAGDGSRGTIEILTSMPEDTLIYCDGAFKSPLLTKPIIARSLMRVQTKFQKDADGRIMATHYGDIFVEFPSTTVETVAKIISPISYSIADRNFKQLTFFAHMMTVAMARQPGWVEAVAKRMDDITPDQRTEFLRVCAASYLAARQREAARNGQTLSLEDVLRPLRVTSSETPAREPRPVTPIPIAAPPRELPPR